MTLSRSMLAILAISVSILSSGQLAHAGGTSFGTATGTGTASGTGTGTDTATGPAAGTSTGVGTGQGTLTGTRTGGLQPGETDDQLDADGIASVEELKKVAKELLEDIESLTYSAADTLDPYNTVASNAGPGALLEGLDAYKKRLENLAMGLDEFGKPMGSRALKRAVGASGANKLQQVLKAQAEAKALATRISDVPKLAEKLKVFMEVAEIGSKVAGAASMGDGQGAVIQFVNGTCKSLVTGAAATAGGALGSSLGPITGIVAGTAAAAAADYAYDSTIGEVFNKIDQVLHNIDQIRMVNLDRVVEQYGRLASNNGITFGDMFKKYMAEKISESEFRSFSHLIRDKIKKRAEEVTATRRAAIATGFDKFAGEHPELKADLDKFKDGKLDRNGQLALLKAIQAIRGKDCSDRLPREIMRDRMAKNGYGKFMKLMADNHMRPPVGLLSCLCQSYSIAGVGINYSPDARPECPADEGPCKGGNFGCVSYGLPGSSQVWDTCLAGNPLAVKKDKAGNDGPAIRLDEYFAGAKIVQEQIKKK